MKIASRRRLLLGAGVTHTGDRRFFERHASLALHAERMSQTDLESMTYFWRRSAKETYRVTLERSANVHNSMISVDVKSVPPPWELTLREHEILNCVAAGMTNPDIAVHFTCARKTIATHVERILEKLGVPSRAGAASLVVSTDSLLAPLPSTGIFVDLPIGQVLASAHLPLASGAQRLNVQRPARKRPIRLGSIYSYEGDRVADSLAMQQGAVLAISEINGRGGINGRSIEHVVVPPNMDQSEALEYLYSNDVDGITIGRHSIEQGLSMLSQGADYGAPTLHSMVAPALTDMVSDSPTRMGHAFQVCTTETAYVAGYLRTLNDLVSSGQWTPKFRRLRMILREDSALPRDAIERMAQGAHWDSDIIMMPQDSAPDWGALAIKLERDRISSVFVGTFSEAHLLALLAEITALDHKPLVYGVWAPSIPDFLDRAGDLADGLVWSTVIGTYADPLSSSFTERYRRRYSQHPGTGSAPIHYDMVHILSQTWADSTSPWDFQSANDRLRRMTYRGVAGPYYFGGSSQRGLVFPDDTIDASLAHAHLVYQVNNGRHKLIGPEQLATQRYCG